MFSTTTPLPLSACLILSSFCFSSASAVLSILDRLGFVFVGGCMFCSSVCASSTYSKFSFVELGGIHDDLSLNGCLGGRGFVSKEMLYS